jgi:glycosyltransferase involved in cell wall biosynthesis
VIWLKYVDWIETLYTFGKQSEEQLFGLIKSARVFVYPTKLDSYGMGVLETSACGTPVVAYGIPAIGFNYHLKKAVTRMPVGDIKAMIRAVITMIKDETLIEKLQSEAWRFASRYT